MLEVYNDATPNGLKVSIALEELALQYDVHRVFLGGEQLTPEFTKLNPNQKIPVLVDSDEDIVLTESGTILVYLAEKTGKLLPKDFKGRIKTIELVFNQMSSLGRCSASSSSSAAPGRTNSRRSATATSRRPPASSAC